jgi:hypothetical protein
MGAPRTTRTMLDTIQRCKGGVDRATYLAGLRVTIPGISPSTADTRLDKCMSKGFLRVVGRSTYGGRIYEPTGLGLETLAHYDKIGWPCAVPRDSASPSRKHLARKRAHPQPVVSGLPPARTPMGAAARGKAIRALLASVRKAEARVDGLRSYQRGAMLRQLLCACQMVADTCGGYARGAEGEDAAL